MPNSAPSANPHPTALRIATRGSFLALWQANFVKDLLARNHQTSELHIFKTTGDLVQDRPLHEIGGKGLFIREIEQALLRAEADVGVHSLKDLPVKIEPSLTLKAFLPRHDPSDLLILGPTVGLPPSFVPDIHLTRDHIAALGAISIGTGSLRRSTLLLGANPDLRLVPIRGNIDTRLARLRAGGHDGQTWDAIILAKAALDRSQLGGDLRAFSFDPSWFVPSAGQGVIAVETRESDKSCDVIAQLDCPKTRFAVTVERLILAGLGGDCTLPVGIHASLCSEQGPWEVRAVVGCQGDNLFCSVRGGISEDPWDVAQRMLDILKREGVNRLLSLLNLKEI